MLVTHHLHEVGNTIDMALTEDENKRTQPEPRQDYAVGVGSVEFAHARSASSPGRPGGQDEGIALW